MKRELPIGIKFLRSLQDKFFPSANINSYLWYRVSIFGLTFLSYMSYHASRKPLSIVKSYFNHSCAGLTPPQGIDPNDTTWCDWAPFYGPDAGALLGTLDSAFLFAYAGAMFLSGYIAERMSLRYFLAVGMISSGIYCYLFGLAHQLQIHFVWYYILVQAYGGIVQSSGWPGVVAVMGNWFGKSKRGFIMGVWNSHTSVGNIVGTLIASGLLDLDWGYSFLVPGLLIAGVGFIDFLFMVEHPHDADLEVNVRPSAYEPLDDSTATARVVSDDSASSDTELLPESERGVTTTYSQGRKTHQKNESVESAVGIGAALAIPGVVEFSLCLFFSKLVCYTFLYWLPFYINVSTPYSSTTSAYLSTIFDIGGIVGGIVAGAVTDYTGKSATVCIIMLIISSPLMIVYSSLGGSSTLLLDIVFLTVIGFFVNGPYALITTAVSAELGSHPSLLGNSKALATVTAIIDGTGSIGAAVGPLLAGFLSIRGWQNVFYMLVAANVFAVIMLLRLVYYEFTRARDHTRSDVGQTIL